MKERPQVDHKNPVYSKHFFENLSLAEKVRLQGNVSAVNVVDRSNNTEMSNGGGARWTSHQSDLSSVLSDNDDQ